MDFNRKKKYNPFTKMDINDIKNILDYARGLIIKDQEIADKLETIESLRSSSLYIQARTGTSLSMSELECKKVIENYRELNPYYKELNKKYGIDFLLLRTTKDLRILKVTRNTLAKEEVILFDDCYYESLRYYNNVISTEAFKNQLYDREFTKMFLVFMTVQRYITGKMEFYFNIDFYNRDMLKNSFISNGIDYFDELPLNYQRRLLKIVNQLIQYKGTNVAIKDILKIFGFDNIDVYKYILSKGYDRNAITGKTDYSDPHLLFFKTKADGNLDFNNDLTLNYDSVVNRDPFWQIDKDYVKKQDFNTINTKYMSVDLTMDIMKETLGMAYFMSLLNKMETEYKDKQDGDFYFYNRNISNNGIGMFDAITALISITLRSHGYKDIITKKLDSLKYVYGYNNIKDNLDIKKLLSEIQILLIQNRNKFENDNKYKEVYQYFLGFKLKNFDGYEEYNMTNVIEEYNSDIVYSRQLERFIKLTKNYRLIEMWEKDYLTIDILNYTKYLLITGKIDYMLLSNFPELKNLFKMLILNSLSNKENDIDEFLNNLRTNVILMNDLDNLISNINNTQLNIEYSNYKMGIYPLALVLDKMLDIIYDRRNQTIGKYKTEEERIKSYRDNPADILHYRELNEYLEIFFINSFNEKEKYSMEDFVKIFKYNESIRNNLEELIVECNDYNLYKKFNKIWNIKFESEINMSLYKGYNTFQDYVKYKNYDLYNFITIPDIIKGDINKEYEFYRTRIFELCESIDNHISESDMNFFLNNNFVGLLEYIKKYIYIIVSIFKSYTIDLLDANTVLSFKSKPFNILKLIDGIESYNSTFKLKDNFKIIDLANTSDYFTEKDKLELSDKINKKIFNI